MPNWGYKVKIWGAIATVAPTIGMRAWGGGAAPQNSGKTIIFRAKAKIFGQKPAAINEKKYFCTY